MYDKQFGFSEGLFYKTRIHICSFMQMSDMTIHKVTHTCTQSEYTMNGNKKDRNQTDKTAETNKKQKE